MPKLRAVMLQVTVTCRWVAQFVVLHTGGWWAAAVL
jgi:hypothetical protein